ncbi:GPI-anchored cell wall protein, putative [Coccidioides posadasii C735 delta SOWgp]|uniref:GPI-anchored cell wall protein, putative n=1 Tax=Coccidioides posadasii (strain C735) TaxID=222929 RepID=C5P8S5_COCP7|nr:GPI-anchored cell wall protein, putative [Coccidioides posadasii C735 delta SOWgp]EER26137.1 GPI-anchored cell wall protein, putative [Coccidioides posadasii C735 delta SOWgp]|eukprot:XP_003068282.1 GPI-anchored cell wall protein, putative [Coccidioides posadasii C735 delta SOWgp]
MFSARAVLFVTVLALLNIFAVATPPGCLIAAINTQEDPSDMDVMCGSASKKVQNEIVKLCDDSNVQAALNAYSKSCSESGNKVDLANSPCLATELIEISTTLATMSATGSPTGSATSPVQPTGSATTTSGSEPIETGNAASSLKSQSFALAAMAAIVGAAIL